MAPGAVASAGESRCSRRPLGPPHKSAAAAGAAARWLRRGPPVPGERGERGHRGGPAAVWVVLGAWRRGQTRAGGRCRGGPWAALWVLVGDTGPLRVWGVLGGWGDCDQLWGYWEWDRGQDRGSWEDTGGDGDQLRGYWGDAGGSVVSSRGTGGVTGPCQVWGMLRVGGVHGQLGDAGRGENAVWGCWGGTVLGSGGPSQCAQHRSPPLPAGPLGPPAWLLLSLLCWSLTSRCRGKWRLLGSLGPLWWGGWG